MKFAELLAIISDEPVFETGLLLAGDVDAADVRRQLSRWAAAGRLHQLRRGVYALAMPYRKTTPHPFVVANHLVPGSYVSGQSALAHYGLIPEYVPAIVSVTTTRPAHWETALGDYLYRHIQPRFLSGYRWTDLGNGQYAFVATPAKSLLDLIYLQPAGDTLPYLQTLRLQNLDRLDLAELTQRAAACASPKLVRAATRIVALARREAEEYQPL